MDHPGNPRALIILLFILVAVTFMVGTLRLFDPIHAAAALQEPDQNGQVPEIALAPTVTSTIVSQALQPTLPVPTASIQTPATAAATLIPTPAPYFTPTYIPVPEKAYTTDMTGIVMLAIVLVVVILVGISWGGRITRKKKG